MNGFITWAFKQQIGGGKKLTLLALAYTADDEGRNVTTQGAISVLTGQSRTSVLKHVAALEREGYLKRTVRRAEDGGRLADQYELLGDTTPSPERASA